MSTATPPRGANTPTGVTHDCSSWAQVTEIGSSLTPVRGTPPEGTAVHLFQGPALSVHGTWNASGISAVCRQRQQGPDQGSRYRSGMSQGPSSGLVHQVEEFLRQAAQQGGPDAGAATSIADAAPQQPELRRPALTEPQLFQVSITLDGAEPPIWRRLELRSNLSLDHVHQAIQCAFYWVDYHLHRFSIGGHAFDQQAQHFLCRYDAEEGDPGIPDAGIELSETIRNPARRFITSMTTATVGR